jgi:hypothetical protein
MRAFPRSVPVLVALLVATPAAATPSTCKDPLPAAALAAPAGHDLAFAWDAVGVQVYACQPTESGPAWVLKAPDAKLYAADGALRGTHFAGPTWQASDGSTVVGAKVAGAAPEPSAIPWLLLRAASHAGTGLMADVTFVQRVQTSGGLAPGEGCDAAAAAAGAVVRVPYTATYCFYRAR